MARNNFSYEKRQRELEKKRKTEEKAKRKLEAKNAPADGEVVQQDGEEGIEANQAAPDGEQAGATAPSSQA